MAQILAVRAKLSASPFCSNELGALQGLVQKLDSAAVISEAAYLMTALTSSF